MFPAVRAGILPAVARTVRAGMHRPNNLDLGASRTTDALRSRALPLPFTDAATVRKSLLRSTLASDLTGVVVARSSLELRAGVLFKVQFDDRSIWLRPEDIYAHATLQAAYCPSTKHLDLSLIPSKVFEVTQLEKRGDDFHPCTSKEEVRFYSGPDLVFADRVTAVTYPAPFAPLEASYAIKVIWNFTLSLPKLDVERVFTMPDIRTLPPAIKEILERLILQRNYPLK